jgi:hypothetical protein
MADIYFSKISMRFMYEEAFNCFKHTYLDDRDVLRDEHIEDVCIMDQVYRCVSFSVCDVNPAQTGLLRRLILRFPTADLFCSIDNETSENTSTEYFIYNAISETMSETWIDGNEIKCSRVLKMYELREGAWFDYSLF